MIVKDLGGRLKNLLKEKNLTQAELADRIGVSRQSLINTMESNDVKKLDTFIEFCKLLEVPVDSFLEDLFLEGEEGLVKPKRTILEVSFRSEEEEITQVYVVPYIINSEYGGLQVFFDLRKITKDDLDINNAALPYLFKETRIFKMSEFQHLMYRIAGFLEEVVFICSKLENKKDIENGKLYITINSEEGISFNNLHLNKTKDLIDFRVEAEGESISQFQLPIDKVYEIWQPVAILVAPKNYIYQQYQEISTSPDLATTGAKGK